MTELTITFRGIEFNVEFESDPDEGLTATKVLHDGTDFTEFFTDDLWYELDKEIFEHLKHYYSEEREIRNNYING